MEVKFFEFGGLLDAAGKQHIRVVMRGGAPWFVLADVCKAIGITNPSDVAKRVMPEHRAGITLVSAEGIRGNPYVTIISEAGLYQTVLGSRTNESTVRFKEWVTADVLPSIRKFGAYSVHPVTPPAELSRRQILEMALKAEQELEEERAKTAHLENVVEVLAPRAAAYEKVVNTDGLISVAEAAKILGVGENTLFECLRNWHFLMDKAVSGQENHNVPYQRVIDAGWFTVRAGTYKRGDKVLASKRTYMTGRGLDKVRERLQTERGLLQLKGGDFIADARVLELKNARATH